MPPNDTEAEIPEHVYIMDNDANSDHSMHYGTGVESPNPLYMSESNSIEHNDDNVVPEKDNNDIHENRHIPSTDPNKRDALNRNPTYETGCCPSDNDIYGTRITTQTTNNDDYGKNTIPPDDIEAEIPEHVYVMDNINDADLDHSMPHGTGVTNGSPNPLYMSECNSIERDADSVVPENDNNDIHENRHIPSPDPNSIPDALNRNPMYVPNAPQQARRQYNPTEHDADNVVPENDNNGIHGNGHIPSTDPNMRDALNRNPMYVPNAPKQARCHCTNGSIGFAVIITTLLVSLIIFGTGAWLFFNNNVREVQKPVLGPPYTNGHPAENTTYNGHPAENSTYTNGHPAEITTYTNGHPAEITTYTNGHPAENTTYIPDVKAGTKDRQEFGGFQELAQHWRFLIIKTHLHQEPRLTELSFYAISSFSGY
uniref:Uncharacterized protein n=1 Tax=Branchiostoma floridae TaxID=7739 RepID=C3XQ03_BRAFL|eukprot:XP_002614015.1 hypothetical protein BRAFLDRAFT_67401 [Branchiostoma floridae]